MFLQEQLWVNLGSFIIMLIILGVLKLFQKQMEFWRLNKRVAVLLSLE